MDAPLAPSSTSWKGVRRFYARVDVRRAGEGEVLPEGAAPAGAPLWRVLIDGRALRTNAMNELLLPSEALALAVAGEFASQGDVILPATTPLYTLASAAIDGYALEDRVAAEQLEAEARAQKLSTFDRLAAVSRVEELVGGVGGGEEGGAGAVKVTDASSIMAAAAAAEALLPPHARSLETGRHSSGAMTSGVAGGTARLRDLLLDSLETDTLCYRIDWDMADPSERLLRKRQDSMHDPLLSWFAGVYGTALGTAVGFNDVTHPDDAYVAVDDEVEGASPWVKAVLGQLVGVTKSTVITLALAHRATDVEGAFQACRVEEEWQIEENGFVEDGHDSARAHTRLTLASAAAFLALLPPSLRPSPHPSPTRRDFAALVAANKAARTARVEARRAREAALVERYRVAMRKQALAEAAEERAKVERARAAAAAVGAAAGGAAAGASGSGAPIR